LGQAVVGAFTSPDWNIAAPSRHELDVLDSIAIKRYLESRPVDLLICAAGVTRDAPLARIQEDAWDEVFAVNYQAAANGAAAVLPRMIRQGRGHIVFISSYSALHPPVGQIAYATAKAALLGIRVNAILPGFLETPMTQSMSEKRKTEISMDHTLGRFNTPDAVAKFIRYLHEDLPHTSGQMFQLDSRIS